MTPPERLVSLEGCFNFRDLGGYIGAGGRAVRWRTLFRADGLSWLTPADLEQLAEMGIRTVVDLRTVPERDEHGRFNGPDADFAYHHLPMIDVLPPAANLVDWVRPAYVADQYMQMLDEGRPVVAKVLGLLSEAEAYPAVFHCMAGKDRTGIVTALILRMLGVSVEDVAADYGLSREGMVRALAFMRDFLPDRYARLVANEDAVLAAEPETMTLFLERLDAEYGGAEEFVSGIGAGESVEALRSVLLEEG